MKKIFPLLAVLILGFFISYAITTTKSHTNKKEHAKVVAKQTCVAPTSFTYSTSGGMTTVSWTSTGASCYKYGGYYCMGTPATFSGSTTGTSFSIPTRAGCGGGYFATFNIEAHYGPCDAPTCIASSGGHTIH